VEVVGDRLGAGQAVAQLGEDVGFGRHYLPSRCCFASSCSERAAGFGALWFCAQGPMFGVSARKRVAKKPNSRYSKGEVLSSRQPFHSRRSWAEYLLPWPRITWW